MSGDMADSINEEHGELRPEESEEEQYGHCEVCGCDLWEEDYNDMCEGCRDQHELNEMQEEDEEEEENED